MFALYAAGGRNRIQVNTMTETTPRLPRRHCRSCDRTPPGLDYAALTDAGAAEAGLCALVAEIARLRDLLGSGTLDDAALYAVRRQLGDLRQCAEALGVGL
jgi:hypothetical protein